MIKELTMEKTSLPAGWEMKKLIELGEVQTGTTPSTSNKGFYGDFIPFVKPPHFNPDGTISFSSSGLSEIGLAKGRLIKENSILMVCIGASIGKTGITPIPISCNQQINAFSPNENCLPKFYYHLLSSDYFFKKVMKRSSQATLPMINKTKWQNIEIPLPPLPQQKQIVAILDKAFAAIDTAKANAEQNLQNAKELFESYLQNIFENKGDDWTSEKMVNCCDIITCGVASTPKYVDKKEGVPFLSAQNVKGGEIILHKFKYISKEFHQKLTKKNKPSKGDILYSRVGAKFGEAGVVEHSFEFSVYVSVTLVRPTKEKLNNYYLKNYLNSPLIKELARKSITSSGVPNLNVKSVREFPISFPSIENQKSIVEKINTFSLQTKKLETIYTQKITDLEEMKKSVLQKAFSGQLNTVN